jgi:Mg2+/citrate symporter
MALLGFIPVVILLAVIISRVMSLAFVFGVAVVLGRREARRVGFVLVDMANLPLRRLSDDQNAFASAGTLLGERTADRRGHCRHD